MKSFYKIGVMQGRLSPIIGKKIQCFPKKNWSKEFIKAKKIGLKYIEWTLDYKDLYSNPIFTKSGVDKIKFLKKKNKINILSLTGDCLMQRPFWKNKKKASLIKDLINIVKACSNLKIKYIIYPLVDNSSLKKADQKKFIYQLKKIMPILKRYKVKILFESDYSPLNLKKFIKKFDKNYFGINYDSGNSSGLGYNIDKEFQMYGKYIQNVHIKDRALKGNTVRLGAGNANFTKLFSNLKKINYKNLLILQTARSHVNNHVDEIKINLNFLKNFQINY